MTFYPQLNRRRMSSSSHSKIIGKGMTGRVYYPALSCKDPEKTPPSIEQLVSKRVSKKAAEREWEKTEILRKIHNKLTIYPTAICEYNEKDMLLYSQYGGISLVTYFTYLESLAEMKRLSWRGSSKHNVDNFSKDEDEYYKSVIRSLEKLKEAVRDLNKKGIVHGDISFDNIVFDDKYSYLIDWERSKEMEGGEEWKVIESLIKTLKICRELIKAKIGW